MTKSLLNPDCLAVLTQAKRLVLGFSGGLDSTVLLYHLAAIPTLAAKLEAVHVNHGLSVNAQNWERHCQTFCDRLAIPLLIKRVHFESKTNIEEEARTARYGVFSSLISRHDCLLLAHHLDDQAETLMLQLFRGAGVEGLAAMKQLRPFGQGLLLRPLLDLRRQALEAYAQAELLQWIEDESNQDHGFSRNYLRHQLMPLVEARWPGASTNLSRTAKHCQQAQENLAALAAIDYPKLCNAPKSLILSEIKALPEARIANVLRIWLKSNQLRLPNSATFNRLISQVIKAAEDTMPLVAWDDFCIRRYQDRLYILPHQSENDRPAPIVWTSFPTPLFLGKSLGTLQALSSSEGLIIPTGSVIELRFRQGGESLRWRGQLKELKKLFQLWQIPPWQRENIPLLYINQQLAAVVGYAISDDFYQKESAQAYELELIPNFGS